MTSPVLVTGAAGLLGGRVVTALRGGGSVVRALAHRRPVADADETVWGDLAEPGSLRPALAGAGAVVHLAAVTHARTEAAYRRANVEGTANLLEAARAEGVRRLVHVSTRAVDERGGWYSASKLAAERLVEGSGLVATIVRLPEVYGAGGREGLDQLLARVRSGRPVPVVGRGGDLVCPLHVDDAVAAIVAALHSPAAAGRTYTLAGECVTTAEFAAAAAAAAGVRLRLVPVPTPVVAALALAGRLLPLPVYPDQLDRLRAPKPPLSPEAGPDLGFAPRPLDLSAAVSPAR